MDIASRSKDKRAPMNDFISNETRFENSLKFTPIWLEAFIITSIVWAFGGLFKEEARKRLDQKLKEKINNCKSDFATY